MGPEENKQEKKPTAQPHRDDQTGVSQPNQSLWDAGKVGQVIAPPPDAVPKKQSSQEK